MSSSYHSSYQLREQTGRRDANRKNRACLFFMDVRLASQSRKEEPGTRKGQKRSMGVGSWERALGREGGGEGGPPKQRMKIGAA